MEITNTLKDRFVSDHKLPIKLFEEPFFTDRLKLFDKQFGAIEKFRQFVEDVSKFSNEEEFFAEYRRIRDNAIQFILENEAFKKFNTMDMNEFTIPKELRKFPSKDIYHSSNVGRKFVSIDMKKANFSCMRHYDPAIFDYAETWEDFIRKFTDINFAIQSKYIREVILGKCNCGRHITYEKYLTSCVLATLLENGVDSAHVVFFSNDEIVLDITDVNDNYYVPIKIACESTDVPLRVEYFTLRKVNDLTNNVELGYIREMTDGTIDFKCFDHFTLPFVIRTLNNEPITELDKTVKYERKFLTTLVHTPVIEII